MKMRRIIEIIRKIKIYVANINNKDYIIIESRRDFNTAKVSNLFTI